MHIFLTDERVKEDGKPKRREYHYDGGIIDFVRYTNENKNVLNETPIYVSGMRDELRMELAMQYTDAYGETIISYVNNIPTGEGGTHETGLKTALTKVFNEYARKSGLLKEKDAALFGDCLLYTSPGTMASLVLANPHVDFVYLHRVDARENLFDTRQIRQVLGEEVPLDTPEVALWIAQTLKEGLDTIDVYKRQGKPVLSILLALQWFEC